MIRAVIWDYDGTLVNTAQKNLNVTKAIVIEVLNRIPDEFPALADLPSYQEANSNSSNWRDLYKKEFKMNEDQVDYAGTLWTKYQLLDNTLAIFYHGLNNVITKLSRHYLQGIVSLNSYQNIKNNLQSSNFDVFFNEIIGYEEVGFSIQKPHPAALLKCISNLKLDSREDKIIYIGDHETDAHCAFNANETLKMNKVISIGALYEKDNSIEKWKYKPDYIVSNTNDLLGLIEGIENDFKTV